MPRAMAIASARIDPAQRCVQAQAVAAVVLALPRAQRAQHLRGEGFVDLVDVEILQCQAVALEHLRRRIVEAVILPNLIDTVTRSMSCRCVSIRPQSMLSPNSAWMFLYGRPASARKKVRSLMLRIRGIN